MNTTALNVRKVLPGLLIDEDLIGTVTEGTTITLNKPAFDVVTMLRGGTEETGFTFTRPSTVTLETEVAGEYYIATCYYSASDDALETIINRADRRIMVMLGKSDSPGTDILSDWSSQLSAAMYLREFASANDENMTRADALEQAVKDDIEAYKKGYQSEQKPRTNYKYVVTT